VQTYPQRVRANILPLSVASTLPEAFEEWSFTERTIDHEEATQVCQLCDKEELRYHFEIENELTCKSLWVGSQCILRFGVSVFQDGKKLSELESAKKLDRLLQQMRLQSCMNALRKLTESEPNDILSNALDYYERNKFLTPKFAFVVFWRLQVNQIDHSPSFFKVTLKKQKYKENLREMKENRVHVIWPALSTAQRKVAVELGHTPPKER
jgi:hypothetical protein